MSSFFSRLTLLGRLSIALVIVGGLWAAKYFALDKGMVFKRGTSVSQNVGTIDLPTAPANAQQTVPALPLPSNTPAAVTGPQLHILIWEWNTQLGMLYANGGALPTKGSLMEKYGVNLKLERQDATDQMQAALVKFAKEYAKNPQTTEGAQAVVIMGDGAASFLAGVNPELEKVGHEYRAQIIGSLGFSYGEDKFMGLPEWRANPQKARGALVAAVIRDGDWNIVVKWAGDNNIPINPDEKTYDPDAINFLNPPDYLEAANKYITSVCEDRDVVAKGVRVGKKQNVCINGVATWTPGDVNVAEKRGGLVTIASTKEYSSQMPAVVVAIGKWARDNRKTTTDFLRAALEGADQVKCYSSALQAAGEVSAKVYNDQNADYWVSYYKGLTKADKQGLNVELGGSKLNNLADNLALFGLAPGSTNVFKVVYNTFGGIDVKLYPSLVPSFPVADSIQDLSFLQELASSTKTMADADKITYNANTGISQKVSERAWKIEFASGKAEISPTAATTLDSIANSAIVSSGLLLKIEGHTDNQGKQTDNLVLSQARAIAVKSWLQSKYSSSFPDSRVTALGKGQEEPVADNATEKGRAQNRRVVIIMGK